MKSHYVQKQYVDNWLCILLLILLLLQISEFIFSTALLQHHSLRSSLSKCSPARYYNNYIMFYFDTEFLTDLRTIARIYYWSPVVFSFFFTPTPLILRHSIYRSWFVACCGTGAGYVCLQFCPFVLLPFANRILTWNGGINAGALALKWP